MSGACAACSIRTGSLSERSFGCFPAQESVWRETVSLSQLENGLHHDGFQSSRFPTSFLGFVSHSVQISREKACGQSGFCDLRFLQAANRQACRRFLVIISNSFRKEMPKGSPSTLNVSLSGKMERRSLRILRRISTLSEGRFAVPAVGPWSLTLWQSAIGLLIAGYCRTQHRKIRRS